MNVINIYIRNFLKGETTDMFNHGLDVKVAPSILASDFTEMNRSLQAMKEWGADWVHCDVMDGMFVPSISFGMPVRISGLGIDATDEVCRMLAEKASLKGAKTLGNFRILKTEDMYQVFKAAAN